MTFALECLFHIFFCSKQQTRVIRNSKKPLEYFIKAERIYKKDDKQVLLKEKREYMQNRRSKIRKYRKTVERIWTSCFSVWYDFYFWILECFWFTKGINAIKSVHCRDNAKVLQYKSKDGVN